MSSGGKRQHDAESATLGGTEDRVYDGDRKSKPRNWRDAFLEEDEPRPSRYREREGDRDKNHARGSERRRDDQRDRHNHGDRRREYDERRGEASYQGRVRERENSRDYHRDRERPREDRSQRYGDTRDRRRDDRDSRINGDKEEGECVSSPRLDVSTFQPVLMSQSTRIDPSPPQPSKALPPMSATAGPSSPRRPVNDTRPRDTPSRGSFHPVNIPSGPRSAVPQTRRTSNTFNAEPHFIVEPAASEPVVVLEEKQDPQKVLEERRRKREEIMGRFKISGGIPTGQSAATEEVQLGNGVDSVSSIGLRTGERTGATTTAGAASLLKQLGTRSTTALSPSAPTPSSLVGPSLAPTPMGKDFDLTKQADTVGEAVVPAQTQDELNSAADYDPTQAGLDDREKRLKDRQAMHVDEIAAGVGEPPPDTEPKVEDEWEEVEIEEDEDDADVDMFAAFGEEEKPKKKRRVTVRRLKQANTDQEVAYDPVEITKIVKPTVLEIVDNVDDTDGYYRVTPGEVLDDGRYQVTINLGKGMFSSVVKAKVLKAVDQERRQDVVGKEVAIKLIRSQESMYVAGRKEATILQKLNDADPEDKKHIVRMERTFEHRGHLCIVTESLSMNLRDVIKRFGKDVGLNMRAVRAYAHQLFLALSLMRKCSVVHADIKPDNVLVSENKATLKVCDLGSASDITESEPTPYLVSRFYRAPEIILGLPYDTAIDVWSIGSTLYELYTGKILFPGRSNNHMLLLMMEVKGKLNHRMIKKATFGEMHFDESLNFISVEKDRITGADVLKTLAISKAARDIKSRLLPPSSVQMKMKDDELKQLQNFIDLLEKCLQLDPARRLTPRDALLHPFVASG